MGGDPQCPHVPKEFTNAEIADNLRAAARGPRGGRKTRAILEAAADVYANAPTGPTALTRTFDITLTVQVEVGAECDEDKVIFAMQDLIPHDWLELGNDEVHDAQVTDVTFEGAVEAKS
jgi:hypothetical protein